MPKKTIIVGLGGTGDWVLTFLKSRLYATYGEDEVKEDVQFLLADTIHAKTREDAFKGDKKFQVKGAVDQHEEEVANLAGVRVENHEYLPLTGEIREVAESIREGKDSHTRHLSWFMADYYLKTLPAAAMNITDGAGQWRQFGRIALSLSTERNEFPRRIEKLIQAAQVPHGDTLMFYLVSSLAGGTGAGTVFDAAALIRHAAKSHQIKPWIVGFLVLPSAFRKVLGDSTMRATQTRSFAAYRELVRLQTQAGQGVPLTLSYSLNHRVALSDKLFDTVFLLDAQTTWKNLADAPPWAGISPSIADGLEVFIDGSAGGYILEDLANASARMANEVKLHDTLPAQFHSLGSHKIVLPARQYAAIFANRLVEDFLQGVLPASHNEGLPRLLKAELTEGDYQDRAQRFARKIPNLFTQIVDLLASRSQDSVQRIRSFASRTLQELRPLLLPKARQDGAASLQLLMKNPLSEVLTGKEVQDEAADAARRLVHECDRRLNDHWQKIDAALEQTVTQVQAEVTAEVEHQTHLILNRELEEFASYPVGSAHTFLEQLVLLCDDLKTKVLRKAEEEVDLRNGSHNSVGYWQQRVASAQTAMEDTRGMDSWLTRSKAWEAQRKYLKAQESFVERQKLASTYATFHRLVEALKGAAEGLVRRLEEWTDKAVLSTEYSACHQANAEIAAVEAALLKAGESFTSSFGLQAYDREKVADVSMGGYREVLFERYAAPLLEPWLGGLSWELVEPKGAMEEPAEERAAQLRLRIDKASPEGLVLSAHSGKELHQRLFDAIKDQVFEKITSLSIFDYFMDQGYSPQQVADYLKEHAGPLLGSVDSIAGSDPVHQIHLLAQQPDDPKAIEFFSELQALFKGSLFDHAIYQESKKRDFDNPYTLTLLYIVQDLRDGQIRVMNDYEQQYYAQLAENDAYIVNHVFRCDQEAARIEKSYLREHGLHGPQGWKRLHPRICRLLDDPARVQLFFQLWALKAIRLERNPEDKANQVWMLLPPGVEDLADRKVVWLTEPPANGSFDQPTNLSPVLAMEQFCFAGRSAKSGHKIPIDFQSLEAAMRRRRNELIDESAAEPAAELVELYRDFLDVRLELECKEPCRRVHTDREAEDLAIVAHHYVTREIDRLEV